MEDIEFDVLDELYFVQSFAALETLTNLSIDVLKTTLSQLITKGWVKCLTKGGSDEVVTEDALDLDKNYQQYHYLATKEGLLAHNSR